MVRLLPPVLPIENFTLSVSSLSTYENKKRFNILEANHKKKYVAIFIHKYGRATFAGYM